MADLQNTRKNMRVKNLHEHLHAAKLHARCVHLSIFDFKYRQLKILSNSLMLMAISQPVVCKLELYDKPSKIMMLAGGGGNYKTLRLKIVYVWCATKAKSLQPS